MGFYVWDMDELVVNNTDMGLALVSSEVAQILETCLLISASWKISPSFVSLFNFFLFTPVIVTCHRA